MRLICDGNHKLLRPIRPIALTFCDALGVARQSKFFAALLIGAALGLLFLAHLSAGHVEALTTNIVQKLVNKYISKIVTDWIYASFLHWGLSNGVFFIFRFCAYYFLCAMYDLGRDVVFALLILLAVSISLALTRGLYTGPSLESWGSAEQVASILLLLISALAWYWSRYISSINPNRKVFDHEVGAALVRFRHR